jgi:hypothetical protein
MSQLFYNFIDQVGGGWQDGLNPAQIKKIKDDVAKLGLRTDEATRKRQEMADALRKELGIVISPPKASMSAPAPHPKMKELKASATSTVSSPKKSHPFRTTSDPQIIFQKWQSDARAIPPALESIDIWVQRYIAIDGLEQREVELQLLPLPEEYATYGEYKRVRTIGGGSCLLNVILMALSPHYRRLYDIDKENCGNTFRKWLEINHSDIFSPAERADLHYGIENILEVPESARDEIHNNTWTINAINIEIGQKLLKALEYGTLIFEITSGMRMVPDLTTYPEYPGHPYILICGMHGHFELVIKTGSAEREQYAYDRAELPAALEGGRKYLKYKIKYLKYKMKYLNLKNNLKNN